MSLHRRNLHSLRQSGNVFFALFGAVALVAVLGGATMTILKGPVTGMQKVTKYTVAENDIIAAATLISRHSLGQPDADCDGDGIIEPVPFHTGAHSAPQGGGSIPANIGVTRLDPWGTEYGYCVWDHGSAVKEEGCGGASANRLSGGVTDTGIVMAIMSAGPDRVFQTSCLDWVDDETPVVNKPTGSDDVVKLYPYAQFLLPTSARSQLKELPNEACTPDTIGIMRVAAGSVEVCLESGWSEISGVVPEVEGNFVDIIGADPSSTDHLSGAITFTQFNGSKPLSVQGNAAVLINGQPATQPISISAGDTVELRANAPDGFEESLTLSVSLGSVTRQWRISTRAALPANLTITPSSGSFTVTGPGTPAYSSPTGFIVRNMGEQITNALTAQLTPLASYEYAGVGNLCGGVLLAPYAETSAQCVVDVRAKSSGEALPAGTLTVGAADITPVVAPLSGTASGFSCTLDGVTVMNGQSRTFYSASSHTNCASVGQSRTCTNGTLSGSSSFQYANCSTLQSCTLDGVTVAHGQSRLFYSTDLHSNCASISQNRTCNNGTLSGSGVYSRANCSAPTSCTLDGVTVPHGQSRVFYPAKVHANCAGIGNTRTCNNGTLSGLTSAIYAECSPPVGWMIYTRISNGSKGNMGGLAGANNICLQRLQAGSWAEKDSITLNSSNVRAFLCDKTTCNNLLPNTTYRMTALGRSTPSPYEFTTDNQGIGPGDTTAWNSAVGEMSNFWSNRGTSRANAWSNSPESSSNAQTCSGWTTTHIQQSGRNGRTGGYGTGCDASCRWNNTEVSTRLMGCNTTMALMCFVNP